MLLEYKNKTKHTIHCISLGLVDGRFSCKIAIEYDCSHIPSAMSPLKKGTRLL